jgi:hypothetical protein
MKRKDRTELNGTAGMEATVAYLQTAIHALDEAAWYFECLGMDTQTEQLNSAQETAQDVRDLLGVFLGDVEQLDPFDSKREMAKPTKQVIREMLGRKKVKVAA